MQFDDYVTAYRRRTMSRVLLAKKKLPSRRERRYGWTDYRSSFKKSYRASALHVTRLTRMTRSRALYTPVKSDGYCIVWSISDRARVSHFYTRHVRRYCIRGGGASYRLRRLMRNRNLNTRTGTAYSRVLRTKAIKSRCFSHKSFYYISEGVFMCVLYFFTNIQKSDCVQTKVSLWKHHAIELASLYR